MSLLRFFKKAPSSSSKEQASGHHARQGHPGQSFPKEWSSHPGPFLNHRGQVPFDQGQSRGGYPQEYPSMGHHYPQERPSGFAGHPQNVPLNTHNSQGYPQRHQNTHPPYFSAPSSMQQTAPSMYGSDIPLSLDPYAQHSPQDSRYRDPRSPYAQGDQVRDHGIPMPPAFQGHSSPLPSQPVAPYGPNYGPQHQGQSYAPAYAQSSAPPFIPEDQGSYEPSSRFASHPHNDAFFQSEQDRLRGLGSFSAGDFRENSPSKPYTPKKTWFFGKKSASHVPAFDVPSEENTAFPLEPANISSTANAMDLKDLRFWDSHPHDDAMSDTEDDVQDQKPLRFVFGIGILILFATFSWLLFRWSTQSVTSTVPHIQADPNPFKVRPDNPGGLVIPHQDKLVYGRLGNDVNQGMPVEHVLPPPEQPMQGGYAQSPQSMNGVHPTSQGYETERMSYAPPQQQGYAQPVYEGYTPQTAVTSQPAPHPQEGQAYGQQGYAGGQEVSQGAQAGYAPPQQGTYVPYREDANYGQSFPQGGYTQPQAGYIESQHPPMQQGQGQQGQVYGPSAPVGGPVQHGANPQNYPPSASHQGHQNTAYYPENYPMQHGQSAQQVQRFDMEAPPTVSTPSPSRTLVPPTGVPPQKANQALAETSSEGFNGAQQPFSAPVFFKAKLGEFKTKQEATQKWQSLRKEQKDLMRSLNHAVVKETGGNGKTAFVLYALGLQGEEDAKTFCSKVHGAKYYKQ